METRVVLNDDGSVSGQMERGNNLWDDVIRLSFADWKNDWTVDLSTSLPSDFRKSKDLVELYSAVFEAVTATRGEEA